MKNSWKLFEIYETPIYLKYWFLLIFLFTTFDWVVAIFASMLIHEISHMIMAKKLGYKTDYIFINILHGGALIDERYNKNHTDTIKISLVGPVSNLILASIILITLSIFKHFNISSEFLLTCLIVNILVFIINIIPIFPLDGGRISKAILSKIFGDDSGRLYNAYLSMILSMLVLLYAISFGKFILIFMSLFLIFIAYSELKNN